MGWGLQAALNLGRWEEEEAGQGGISARVSITPVLTHAGISVLPWRGCSSAQVQPGTAECWGSGVA